MGLFFFISVVMSASPEYKVFDLWLRAKTPLSAEVGYSYSSLLAQYNLKNEDSSKEESSAGRSGPSGSPGVESRINAHCRMLSVRKNLFDKWEVDTGRTLSFKIGQLFRSRVVVSSRGSEEIYLFPVRSKDLRVWDSEAMFRIHCDSTLWKIPRSTSLPAQFEKSERLTLIIGESLSLLRLLLRERFIIESSLITMIEI